MRRLPERGPAPATLQEKGPAARSRVIAAASLGSKKLTFSSAIYGGADVREALDRLHNGNCAYCEVKVAPVAKGDVEHFRPKGCFKHEGTGKRVTPGYYWLAYEWSNLLLACPSCNSASNKGVRFPIENEASRARTPEDPIEDEVAMLINPFEENPRDSIRFRGAVAYSVAANPRGRACIEVLGLNAHPLVEAREERLRLVAALEAVVLAFPGEAAAAEAAALLKEFLAPNATFSSCLQDRLAA